MRVLTPAATRLPTLRPAGAPLAPLPDTVCVERTVATATAIADGPARQDRSSDARTRPMPRRSGRLAPSVNPAGRSAGRIVRPAQARAAFVRQVYRSDAGPWRAPARPRRTVPGGNVTQARARSTIPR